MEWRGEVLFSAVSTVGLVSSAHLTRQYCPYAVEMVDWEWFITITGLYLLGLAQTRQKVGVDSVDPRTNQLVLTPPPLAFHTSASPGAAITSSIDFQGQGVTPQAFLGPIMAHHARVCRTPSCRNSVDAISGWPLEGTITVLCP